MTDTQLNQGEDAKRTAGNISSAFLIRAARYPFLVLFIIFIPRMLGPSDYGKYAFIVSVLMLVSELFTFGIPVVFGRFIPEYLVNNNKSKVERLVSFYLFIWLICSCLLAISGIIFYFAINFHDKQVFAFLIIYFALISEILSLTLFSLLFGLNYVGRSNVANLFRSVFRLMFLIALYPLLGFYGALISLLLTSLASILYAIISIRKVIDIKLQKFSFREFFPQLKFGIIIFTPTLLFLFQQQIGPVFLKIFSFPDKEIGYFDLANQGFLVLYGLSVTSFEALIPIASKFELIGKKEKNIDWLFMLLRYILPALFIIITGFYMFGKEAIDIILSKEYLRIYLIALIILSSIPVWIIGQIGYVRSVSLSNAGPYLRSTIISTVIFILSGIVLVKNFGAVGVASAVFISGTTFTTSILIAYKEMISRLLNIIIKIIVSMISFSLTILLNFQTIELKIFLFVFSISVFLIILIKLKIINLNELLQLISGLGKKTSGRVIPIVQ